MAQFFDEERGWVAGAERSEAPVLHRMPGLRRLSPGHPLFDLIRAKSSKKLRPAPTDGFVGGFTFDGCRAGMVKDRDSI
jgi:hypothetical protein